MSQQRSFPGRDVKRIAARVTFVYLIISALWILFSDHLLYQMIHDYRMLQVISTFKGWFFVLVTSLMLYSLITRDVTDIETAEKLRMKSEISFKGLAESITDIFFALDDRLRVTYWNRAVEEFSGTPSQNVVGRDLFEAVPILRDTPLGSALQEVLRTRTHRSFMSKSAMRHGVYLDVNIYPIPQGMTIIAKDVTERVHAEEQMKESLERLNIMLEGTVNVLASVAEKRDPYIAGHQHRTAKLAAAIARELNLPGDQVEGIRVAGVLHDIGKISIPAEILNKPGPLTENEFSIVKIYPQISYEILKNIQFPWPVAQIALQHQEKMNGTGYPAGLKGDRILQGARILAVADFVDATSSHRPYRPSRGIEHALKELEKYRGVLYDETVVDAALNLFAAKKFELV